MTTIHFYWRTRREANAFDRRVYRVTPTHGLGWTPYKILVLRGAVSETAFHSVRDFRLYLKSMGLKATVNGRYGSECGGVSVNRFGVLTVMRQS